MATLHQYSIWEGTVLVRSGYGGWRGVIKTAGSDDSNGGSDHIHRVIEHTRRVSNASAVSPNLQGCDSSISGCAADIVASRPFKNVPGYFRFTVITDATPTVRIEYMDDLCYEMYG